MLSISCILSIKMASMFTLVGTGSSGKKSTIFRNFPFSSTIAKFDTPPIFNPQPQLSNFQPSGNTTFLNLMSQVNVDGMVQDSGTGNGFSNSTSSQSMTSMFNSFQMGSLLSSSEMMWFRKHEDPLRFRNSRLSLRNASANTPNNDSIFID